MLKRLWIWVQVNVRYAWQTWLKSLLLGIGDAFAMLTMLIWGPVMMLLFYLFGFDEDTIKDDVTWCKAHGMEYPSESDFPHHQVKKWKREIWRQHKHQEKEKIRRSIMQKQKQTNR